MLATAIGFLALFALVSILLGDDPRQGSIPRDDVWFWSRYSHR